MEPGNDGAQVDLGVSHSSMEQEFEKERKVDDEGVEGKDVVFEEGEICESTKELTEDMEPNQKRSRIGFEPILPDGHSLLRNHDASAFATPGKGKKEENVEGVFPILCQLDARLQVLEAEMKQRQVKCGNSEAGGSVRSVSKSELMQMVWNAIGSGSHDYGVNRSFVRKFLADRYDVPMTPNYIKRINNVLQMGVDVGQFAYDSRHGLFLLA